MHPSCYLLQEHSNGTASLYLGEVGTEECLSFFQSSQAVALQEFGASSGSHWISADEMPVEETVEWWRECLSKELFDLVDFTATIGLINLSTHDDGEATFTVGSSQEALELLPRLIGEQAAACVIPYLQANLGCYISIRNSQPTVHTTFDEYLVGA